MDPADSVAQPRPITIYDPRTGGGEFTLTSLEPWAQKYYEDMIAEGLEGRVGIK